MLTSSTIDYMPKILKSFRKYIEKYECTYMVAKSDLFPGEICYSLIFYHKGSGMPYLMVSQHDKSKYATIYVNKYADNWSRSDCVYRDDCNISNNIMEFIKAISECLITGESEIYRSVKADDIP